MRTSSLHLSIAILLFASVANAQKADTESGFVSLFDGSSLKGWKLAEENPDAWHVEDG